MSILLEVAQSLQPGTPLQIVGSEHLYTVNEVIETSPEHVKVLIDQYPDKTPGLGSWFDERHLDSVTVVAFQNETEKDGSASQSDLVAGRNASESEDESADDSTAEPDETDSAVDSTVKKVKRGRRG